MANPEQQEIVSAETSAEDLRERLAVERTELALERTHLAWVRTLFALIGAGIALDKGLAIMREKRLLEHATLFQNGHIIGIALILLGTLLLISETVQYVKRSQQLARMKNASFSIFSSNFILSIIVILTGLGMLSLIFITD